MPIKLWIAFASLASLVTTAQAAEWRGRIHDRDHYLAAFAEWASTLAARGETRSRVHGGPRV